jgi:hypothetical protein
MHTTVEAELPNQSTMCTLQACSPPIRRFVLSRKAHSSDGHWQLLTAVTADTTSLHDASAPAPADALEYEVTAWSPNGRCATHLPARRAPLGCLLPQHVSWQQPLVCARSARTRLPVCSTQR